MRATVTDDGRVALVGRLDVRGAPAARDALHAALAGGGGGPLLVDLSGVELLDATGLGVLVGVHRRARLQDRELVLCDARPRVARLLSMTRLDRVIAVQRRRSVPA
ncbi:MAG: STAS domain-containing protein [Mycobacteriales bacterium]